MQDRDELELDIIARDVSRCREPVAIPLIGLTEEQIARLRQLEYTPDSKYDGYPLDTIDRSIFQQHDDEPNDRASDDSDGTDSQSSSGDVWGCDCAAEGVKQNGSVDSGTCARGISRECECIASFGHFYAPIGPDAAQLRLLLDALPAKLPLVECSSACLCVSNCQNRLTQTSVRLPLAVKSTFSGLGLFYNPTPAGAPLPSGIFISLYAGEYLTTPQARERWAAQHAHPAGEGNYILSLRLPEEIIHIDPRSKGNVGRFLNHSCDPNCVIQVVRWGPDSVSRAAIFTKRTIQRGEELTFDYGDASGADSAKDHKGAHSSAEAVGQTACLCGSSNCRGWMPFDPSL